MRALSGIESDSSQSYIDEAISEVINIMKTQLLTLGFTEDDINEAQKRSLRDTSIPLSEIADTAIIQLG